MRKSFLSLCKYRGENIGGSLPSITNHCHFYHHSQPSQLARHVRSRTYVRLSPNEVTGILRKNEYSSEVNLGSVKSYDTNQLASNSPIEDARSEARCLLTTGMLFGVFDGHGGPACGQVVAKRLFRYIAASLVPRDILLRSMNPNVQSMDDEDVLIECLNDRYDLVEDLKKLYETSFQNFINRLAEEDSNDFRMNSALEKAFLSLDDDLSAEAFINKNKSDVTDENSLAMKTLAVALSGAVACVSHIDGEHLHVASCGDCRAVLGSRSGETEDWLAVPLTTEHNSENIAEVKRILSEHPENEKDTAIRNDRLLGQLAPLRAFGDFRFKWTTQQIKDHVVPYLGEASASTPNSMTPPYLTARPEVTYHKLRVKDSFLIIASDGLWDMLSPSQAVRLVGEHMSGKTVLSPFKLPENQSITLGEIHRTLLKRSESFKLKPIDQNAATHLIRHALGGTEQGLDHNKISNLLTLPQDSVRLFRDDITVTVIYFDPEYLSQRPL